MQSVSLSLAPKSAGDVGTYKTRLPSMQRFTELPITVQHVWDSYPAVDNALAALEQGQFQDAATLADAIYTDDRVIGCLSTRINGLFGLPLEFKWPGQDEAHGSVKPSAAPSGQEVPTQHVTKDEDKDPPEVQELKEKIVRLAERNWEKMLPGAAARDQMRWGIMLNAGIGELVWDWGHDNLLWPTMRTWNSQFIYWRWDTRSYWLIHQDGQTELTPGDGRWVLFSPTGHNHGWLYGLIRALGKLWLDRVFAFRDWSRASEKYSLGVIKAKVPISANKDDKGRFASAMTNLSNEPTIILPQGADGESSFDVEMMQTDSAVNWQSFKERVHQLDVSIAVCLLGQNLSTEVEKGGSRAAAQVHDNVRGDFLKADDEIWSTMIRTQMLTPWVQYNWGDEIAAMGREVLEFVPVVKHKVDPPEDLQKKATAILQISQAVQGLAGTEADIHALLDEHGIPVTDERNAPSDVPPGGDVNERPSDSPKDQYSPGGTRTAPADVGADGDKLSVTAGRRYSLMKPGQRKGRLLVDELVDGAKLAGAKALEARRAALLHIVQTSQDFAEMKARIKQLYWEAGPSELRGIVEKAVAASQLLGHVSASVDHGA